MITSGSFSSYDHFWKFQEKVRIVNEHWSEHSETWSDGIESESHGRSNTHTKTKRGKGLTQESLLGGNG